MVDFTIGLRPHAHACEVILPSRENMGMLRSNRVSYRIRMITGSFCRRPARLGDPPAGQRSRGRPDHPDFVSVIWATAVRVTIVQRRQHLTNLPRLSLTPHAA